MPKVKQPPTPIHAISNVDKSVQDSTSNKKTRGRLPKNVFAALWEQWTLNRNIPSKTSRHAWAIANNVEVAKVDAWFYRRKCTARKAGVAFTDEDHEGDNAVVIDVKVEMEDDGRTTRIKDARASAGPEENPELELFLMFPPPAPLAFPEYPFVPAAGLPICKTNEDPCSDFICPLCDQKTDINATGIEAIIASTCSPDATNVDDAYSSAFLELRAPSDLHQRIPLPFDPESIMELSALPFLDRSPDCAMPCRENMATVGDESRSGPPEWIGPLIGTFLPDIQANSTIIADEADLGASFVLIQNPLDSLAYSVTTNEQAEESAHSEVSAVDK